MKRLACCLIALSACACGGNDARTVALDSAVRLGVAGAANGHARVHLDGASAIVWPAAGAIAARPAAPRALAPSNELAFAPATLALELDARDGHATLGALSLPLGDLTVYSPALPPEGVALRELALELDGGRLARTAARADGLALAGTLTFRLRWKLVLDDGSLYALGPVDVGPMDTSVTVTEDDAGALTLEIAAACPAACGGVDELFALRDGAFSARAPATVR